ncbi:MAG: hypothetical protein LBT30_07130 [Clostridiales bacterium]|jgi:hypothetical protein|nr:hypothetical protein [Clostridiales bacterium]
MSLFKKKKKEYHIRINLKAKFNAIGRAEIFEDTFDKVFKEVNLGEIDGGGTLLAQNGEPLESDIEINLTKNPVEIKDVLIRLMDFGLPKGSSIITDNDQWSVGSLEGIGIYLNGTDLDENVYKTSDIDLVISEIIRLIGADFKYYSFWEGATETALYFYGNSFDNMKERITPFLSTYPLCQKCRVVQIV